LLHSTLLLVILADSPSLSAPTADSSSNAQAEPPMNNDVVEEKVDKAKAILESLIPTNDAPLAKPDRVSVIDSVQETRLCSCKETDTCRRESSQGLNTCMEECSGEIELLCSCEDRDQLH
ncbi:hypothetical protein PENTCL1PPCAC_18771, partial [Pristionchus entomophagus]